MAETKHASGAQALENIKQQWPAEWQLLVNRALQKIKAAKKDLKLEDTPADTHEAVLHCMKLGDGLSNAHCLLAAGYLLDTKNRLEREHIAVELRALRIEAQLEKLPGTSWPDNDKATLTRYYNCCLAKVKEQIDHIINEITATAKDLGIKQPDAVCSQPINHRYHGPNWGNRGGAVGV